MSKPFGEVEIFTAQGTGYQVLSLASSEGFFQMLVDSKPQLILLDLRLPELDGYTRIEQIQQ